MTGKDPYELSVEDLPSRIEPTYGNHDHVISVSEMPPQYHIVGDQKRIYELAAVFAQVHMDDGDCLGEAARELKSLLPVGTEPASDIDC